MDKRDCLHYAKKSTGPFSKLTILAEQQLIHPDKSRQELLIEISAAILNAFPGSKTGWWDLVDRETQTTDTTQ